LVSAAEAAVVKVVESVEEKKEQQALENGSENVSANVIPWSVRLRWLFNMLMGGAVLLAFEHVWHGEVTPWFPFLTAMSDPGDAAEMFHEMATVGVCMALLITAAWGVMCVAANAIVKRPEAAPQETKD
jgi:hypothetical protein